MKKIVITGAHGIIGTVLMKELGGYQIIPVILPKIDVRNYSSLVKVFSGSDVIIHLAWDDKEDNFRSSTINSDNTKMFSNVYKAAVTTKIKRVIMASSVHAKENTPYGAHKRFMEELGKYYAEEYGLDIICIRFGGINSEDTPNIKEKNYKKIWLSHSDCVVLVTSCIERKVPRHFQIVYGISKKS